jgi:hypothetical protein
MISIARAAFTTLLSLFTTGTLIINQRSLKEVSF